MSQDPVPPQYPVQMPPGYQPISTGTTLAILLLGGVIVVAFYWSLFWAMATDACPHCRAYMLYWAWAVGWGGMLGAIALTAFGIRSSRRNGTSTVSWPLTGIVVVIGTSLVGTLLANEVIIT